MANQSKANGTALSLTTRPSPWLIGVTLVAHGLALVACIANALPLMVKIALVTLVGGLGWPVIRRLNAEHVAITHNENSGWTINGLPVVILAATTMSQLAIFLQFTAQNNNSIVRQSAVICYDALKEEDFRQLRARLKTTYFKPLHDSLSHGAKRHQ